MLDYATSATEEQAQKPISWEEPPSVEHLVTQEEHTLVGPSSWQHHLGEKEVNVQIRKHEVMTWNMQALPSLWPQLSQRHVIISFAHCPSLLLVMSLI